MLNKIAAILSVIIGAMAIFAGGKVLLGVLPDYYVIAWLPVYNFILGLVSALIASAVIWKNSRFAQPVAALIFGAHAIVMLILLVAYRPVVAMDSLVAMTVRLTVWSVILLLLLIQRRRSIASTHPLSVS